MNATPNSSRFHIALFGRRNAGKSALLNALTAQPVAVVSPVPGTTTDPVSKAMEILPLGPVLFTDTPGLDDDDPALGPARVARALSVLATTDAALLVLRPDALPGPLERQVADACRARAVPLLPVFTHADVAAPSPDALAAATALSPGGAGGPPAVVSSVTRSGIPDLLAALSRLPSPDADRPLLADLLPSPKSVVVFVTPIDSAAPKGRLILPQQQAVRDALDHAAVSVVVRETELPDALAALAAPPALVVTDSQAFKTVDAIVPPEVPLTSFSILFARLKGDLPLLVAGADAVDSLQDGSRVLIAEACTHHRQEDDIATVKIPRLLRAKTGKALSIDHTAGADFPPDLSSYSLVVHCGACMLTRKQTLARLALAHAAGVPVTNYGVLIAKLLGILPRAIAPLSNLDQ